MVGSSKILTVSYGTFSCTLEGFDEPFDTMKSIAEYFRDLAADDRYFGAEPPQPDAQMLHQIAEREVKRRVEARVEKNGVVLRQTADATAGSPAGLPLTRPAEPTQAPRRASPPGDDRRPSPARSDAGDNTPFEVEIDGDSVAAKLSRIRAVVARARASREADTAFAEDEPVEPYVAPVRSDFFVADAPVIIDDAEEADDFAVEAATVPADDAESPVSLSDMIDDAGLDEFADPTETLAEAFDTAETDAPEDVSTPKVTISEISVTDVSMTEVAMTDFSDTRAADTALETAPLVEETAAEDFADEPEDDTGQILASVLAETAGNADELHDATPDSMTTPDVETIDTAAQESELPAQTDAESDIVAKIAEPEDLEIQFDDNLRDALDDTIAGLVGDSEPDEALTATPSIPSAPHARIIKLKRTEFEAALASGEIEEVEDDDDLSDTEDMFAEIELDADEPSDAIADTGTMETHDDPTARDDLLTENVFAADPDTDDDFDNIGAADDTLTDGIRNLIGETSLDEEDENDLLAELAAVERAETETANPIRAPHPLADANFDETPTVAQEAPVEQDEAQGDEQALNRLLTETNAKLNDTEGSRRRSAIAHLKAAVAATKADKLLKGQAEKVKDETLIQYRDDLAQVVRPRRPVAGGQTGEGAARERPADPLAARPAPLVLVSEQRIDRPAEPKTPVGSVRPRRVSRPQVASAESLPASDRKGNAAISFADFSEQRGASDLPDILEAAAAYAALTEGQTEISRPELLRRVATLRPDLELSREKGLQSFGQLLRTGRIRKVGQGQFALSNQAQPSQSRVSAG